MWFDAAESTTMDFKGAKSVSVCTTGAKRQRCTVKLYITADNRKLQPYVVLRERLSQNRGSLRESSYMPRKRVGCVRNSS